jgi:hypothetical protein
MNTVPSHIRDAIDKVMDRFDFHKVQKTMKHLNWKWAYSESPDMVPSEEELRKRARELLSSSWEQLERQAATQDMAGGMIIGSGGLEASFDFNRHDESGTEPYDISLKFVVAESDNF